LVTKLYNPRRHNWHRHFRWEGPNLVGAVRSDQRRPEHDSVWQVYPKDCWHFAHCGSGTRSNGTSAMYGTDVYPFSPFQGEERGMASVPRAWPQG
jgi:hypothetical protein